MILTYDPVAEATDGQYQWEDPGMADFQRGWEAFAPGQRVDVYWRASWVAGTIRQTPAENGMGIVVECDTIIDPQGTIYGGRGIFVRVRGSYRRNIVSVLRTAGRSRRVLGHERGEEVGTRPLA